MKGQLNLIPFAILLYLFEIAAGVATRTAPKLSFMAILPMMIARNCHFSRQVLAKSVLLPMKSKELIGGLTMGDVSVPLSNWKRLDAYKSNVTSQHGEDGIIEHLLSLLPDTPKLCLEVGAHDGFSMSNTNHLWAALGWSAVLIEAAPSLFDTLKGRVSGFPNVTAINALITPTGTHSLAELVGSAGMPSPHVGVLSLDIDANELEVLENLGTLVADIVVIEFNHEFPPDFAYRDLPGDVFFRHSVKAVEMSAHRLGYRVVACAGPNAILVREAACKESVLDDLPDLPVEALFDYSFMRNKRNSRLLVRSKFLTEEMGYIGEPSSGMKFLVRARSNFRKLRQILRGNPIGAKVTEKRRLNLRRQGIWI